MEQIYTIPVNEAFEKCASGNIDTNVSECRCPFCELYGKYEADEIDLILGAAMMEPDIRKKTNEKGFCRPHFDMMFRYGKKLPLALILESHLDEVRSKVTSGSLFASASAARSAKKLNALGESCYICDRLNYNFDRSVECAVILWQSDGEFRRKFAMSPYFCLPHYTAFVTAARDRMSKKEFSSFFADISHIESRYFDKLSSDVSLFVKKFDYRYENEPWGDSRDSTERAIKFLTADIHRDSTEKKPSGGLT